VTDIATIRLHNRAGQMRTVDELTTLFDLCLVVVDGLRPRQLHHIEPVVERIDRTLGDADCTFGVLVVGVDPAGAIDLLGPLAERVAVFADPDGTASAALGVTGGPALVWIDTQPAVRAVVPGWDGNQWKPVLTQLAERLAWTRPLVPAPGDPHPIGAQPFAVAASPTARNRQSRAHHEREEERHARLAA